MNIPLSFSLPLLFALSILFSKSLKVYCDAHFKQYNTRKNIGLNCILVTLFVCVFQQPFSLSLSFHQISTNKCRFYMCAFRLTFYSSCLMDCFFFSFFLCVFRNAKKAFSSSNNFSLSNAHFRKNRPMLRFF